MFFNHLPDSEKEGSDAEKVEDNEEDESTLVSEVMWVWLSLGSLSLLF